MSGCQPFGGLTKDFTPERRQRIQAFQNELFSEMPSSGSQGSPSMRERGRESPLENLAEGATIYDFIEWFGGVEESEVKAVLEHLAQDLRAKATDAYPTQ